MKKELTLTAEDMMDIHHATVKLNAINDKIKELYNQKTKEMKKRTLQDLADTLAKAIEDLKGLTNEKIPYPIKMEESHILSGKMLAIPFNNNKQSLYVYDGQYYVTSVSGELVDCTLTPCKREDLKPGDVAFCTDDDEPDLNDLIDYCVVLNDEEIVYINGKSAEVMECNYNYWCKVEKI